MLSFVLMLINSVLLVGFTFLMAAPLGLFIEGTLSPIIGFLIGVSGSVVPHYVQDPFWYLMMVFTGAVTLILIIDLLFGAFFAFFHRSLTRVRQGQYFDLFQDVTGIFRLRRVALYIDENDEQINAYARSNFRYSSITITAGMIERLETIREEQGEQQWLEVTRALIGHECSHIYHFDVVPQYLLCIGLDMGNSLFHFTVTLIILLGRAIMVVPIVGQLIGAYLIIAARWTANVQVVVFHSVLWLQGVFYRVLSRRKEYRADRNGAQVSNSRAAYSLLREVAELSDCQRMAFLDTHPPIERRVLRQSRRLERPWPEMRPGVLGKVIMSILAVFQITALGFFFVFAAESAGVVDIGALRQIRHIENTAVEITGVNAEQVSPTLLLETIWDWSIMREIRNAWSAGFAFQTALIRNVARVTEQWFPAEASWLIRFVRSAIPFIVVAAIQIFLIVAVIKLLNIIMLRLEVLRNRNRINRDAESPLDFLVDIALRTGNFRLLRFALGNGAQLPVLEENDSPMYRYVQMYSKGSLSGGTNICT